MTRNSNFCKGMTKCLFTLCTLSYFATPCIEKRSMKKWLNIATKKKEKHKIFIKNTIIYFRNPQSFGTLPWACRFTSHFSWLWDYKIWIAFLQLLTSYLMISCYLVINQCSWIFHSLPFFQLSGISMHSSLHALLSPSCPMLI